MGLPCAGAQVLSLTSYAWGRTLVHDSGIAAPELFPTRGIAAGSAHATFELTLYLLAAMRAMKGEHPQHGLSLWVDDLIMRARYSTTRGAVAAIKAIADSAIAAIQDDLGLPFASEKAVTLASSRALQKRAHAALQLGPDPGPQQAPRLGVVDPCQCFSGIYVFVKENGFFTALSAFSAIGVFCAATGSSTSTSPEV